MSVNSVDPTKKTTLPFLNVDPPKSEAKKPTLNQDASVNAPKADLAAFVAAQLPQKLDGPGVSSGVFGSKSPNVAGMSERELATNMGKMAMAMKANPAKVNAGDFAIYKAMLDRAQVLTHAQLNSKAKPADMSNRELFGVLVAFDAAKASGTKLTKDQQAQYGALESEWKKRGTYDAKADMKAELKFLHKEREHVYGKMLTHCSAASLGALSLTSHVGAFGIAASAIVIKHAASEGAYGEVAFEGALAIAARFPMVHKLAEGVATAANGVQCAAAVVDLERTDHEIGTLKAKLSGAK